MSKIIIAISMAVLMWVLPANSMAASQHEERKVLQAYLVNIDGLEAVTPASARFSIRIGPSGSFAFGTFGRRGFNKFGNKGFYPHRPYKFGRYYGHRYGYKPFIGGYDRFNRDRFFYDRYSRFPNPGFSSPYYSPFGTRRPGW